MLYELCNYDGRAIPDLEGLYKYVQELYENENLTCGYYHNL